MILVLRPSYVEATSASRKTAGVARPVIELQKLIMLTKACEKLTSEMSR